MINSQQTIKLKDYKMMSPIAAIKNAPNQNEVAKVIVEYIKSNMGDPEDSDDDYEEWREFPRLIMKVFTANSFFFTNLMEMSVSTDIE